MRLFGWVEKEQIGYLFRWQPERGEILLGLSLCLERRLVIYGAYRVAIEEIMGGRRKWRDGGLYGSLEPPANRFLDLNERCLREAPFRIEGALWARHRFLPAAMIEWPLVWPKVAREDPGSATCGR